MKPKFVVVFLYILLFLFCCSRIVSWFQFSVRKKNERRRKKRKSKILRRNLFARCSNDNIYIFCNNNNKIFLFCYSLRLINKIQNIFATYFFYCARVILGVAMFDLWICFFFSCRCWWLSVWSFTRLLFLFALSSLLSILDTHSSPKTSKFQN